MTDQIIQKFIEENDLNMEFFANDPDAEIWVDLITVLALAYQYKVIDKDKAVNEINYFMSLNHEDRLARLNDVNFELGQQIEEEMSFWRIYGDDIIKGKFEAIFNNIPDLKTKIAFLFILETGKYPEEDPAEFEKYTQEIVVQLDPQLQAQSRLQKALSDRNQLHLGSLEARRSRAVSAEEVQSYINNRPGGVRNQNLINPNMPQPPQSMPGQRPLPPQGYNQLPQPPYVGRR